MTDRNQHISDYQQLLRDLKTTVEGLLVSQVANLWSIYGGLNRLHNSIDKIFRHECRFNLENTGYYNFIQGLEWLQPETSKSYFSLDCEYKSHVPPHLKNDKAAIWLYCSLENHSLSQKLCWLISDKTHLLNCYPETAFLCQEQYAEATLICLRAVERNQPSLISEINPCLLLSQNTGKEFYHRRCSSYPDNYLKNAPLQNTEKRSKTLNNFNDIPKTKPIVFKEYIKGKLKPWQSMPNLQINNSNVIKHKIHTQSKTTPSTPIHTKKISPSALKVDYNSLQCHKFKKSNLKKNVYRKKEIRHVIIDNRNIVEHTPSLSSSQSSGTVMIDDLSSSIKSAQSHMKLSRSPKLVGSFLPLSGEKDYNKKPKKSFIEDGGMSVLPMATGYFPKPIKGQSLMSFLTTSQFTRTNAELDRENAHFSISEAIISAMEQIKCRRDLKITDEQIDDSDPEIMDLKQRIRLRRRAKLVEKQRKVWTEESMLKDGKVDTCTSVSPCSTTSDTQSSSSSDEIDDLEVNETSNLFDKRGLSISMASLYSEADVMKRPRGAPDGASDIFSAEGVALSLISKFSEKQLPRASDLDWLVSEEETQQALLPMPKSWPISPDDSQNIPLTPLRGTQEWAPPRPQIIFTFHPTPSRKILMIKQNYRCAGCSMKVAPQYASRFRYCDYLGRYFCTGCHTNQLALIPGRIIQKWDFTRYPVSNFSYRLLEQMNADPLFRIFELNKNIGKRSKNLEICRKYRWCLYYIKDFVYNCRFADAIRKKLEEERSYLLSDPEMFSMEDLVNIRNGVMKNKLYSLIDLCRKHTSDCELCLARGFICEICHSNQVIFPWQISKVIRCNKCGTCFHLTCWNPDKKSCPKCIRINIRRVSLISN